MDENITGNLNFTKVIEHFYWQNNICFSLYTDTSFALIYYNKFAALSVSEWKATVDSAAAEGKRMK